MLTRLVRIQLVLFAIASVVGIVTMLTVYLQAPTLLGIGRIEVIVELPSTGGLYRFSNVTYRGVKVGNVTEVTLRPRGAQATLSLADSPRIPANSKASVRSISAIGEQYLDLQPSVEAPPYLREGSVIAMADVTVPQEVGPLLDQTSALIESIPKDKLGLLLDESFQAFDGAGYDLGSLIDSSVQVSGQLAGVRDQARALIDSGAPVLDGQAETADQLRIWAHSLAEVTGTLVEHDQQYRTLLKDGPATADEVSRLLEQLRPTVPVLLANLTSLGQVMVTYRPGLEQLLVLFPPFVANILSAAPDHNPTGMGQGDFTFTEGDPPSCTVGFLPPNQWRSPEDTTVIDTPDDMYCKLPQDSPLAVRGARNYPCMGKPGKRAATVTLCNSDEGFTPLAMRQHIIGPYPLDPNLIAQGVPPDSRVTSGEDLYAPVEGTPPPPEVGPDGTPAPLPQAPAPLPEAPGPEPASANAIPAAPSAYGTNDSHDPPAVEFAQYDPASGRYVASSGQTFVQTNVAVPTAPRTWRDLVLIEPA